MTTDPRATARQWLAEVLYDLGDVLSFGVEDIADAILSAPGVEVDFAILQGAEPRDDIRRVALLLPPDPVERFSCLDPACPGEHPSPGGVCWPGDPYYARRSP